MSELQSKFSDGDLVVVAKINYGDEDYYDVGFIGIYKNSAWVDFNNPNNAFVRDDGNWACQEGKLRHYTPIENLPLWKSNHMYLNEAQKTALRSLLHRVQWDEKYAKNIGMNSLYNNSIIVAFVWEDTEEGQDFWEEANDQYNEHRLWEASTGATDEDFIEVEEETVATNYTSEYFLQRAIDLQQERGKEYDCGQERSMSKTVEVFNIITGQKLSESEGWLFMQVLKDVRQWTKPEYHADSAEDCISYAALKAEALASGK